MFANPSALISGSGIGIEHARLLIYPIVVAIILIIAAIAIPNLMRSKMAANESSAVGSIRTINTAMVTYSTAYPTVGFATALGNLGGAPATCATSGGCGWASASNGSNRVTRNKTAAMNACISH
jgi:type II secretory pathway pseudopilin PulG